MSSSNKNPLQNLSAPLFKQFDFSGGLNTQLDATKTPENSYPLLINGRTRKNTIAPTNQHVNLNGPVGNYQGLYIAGSFLVVFISGIAYYADIQVSPVIFYPVDNWTPMSSTAERIYAELVPATANLFNRKGDADDTTREFNSVIAVFEQALFCFDGNIQQAILPDGSAVALGSYASWTQDNPLYVPSGVLPAFASNKLFLASPDLKKVLQSVSGRASDFMVNIDIAGNAGGDADTVSQTVSFNPITAIRSIATGEVLVGTLYGTFVLELDYTRTIFGEPFLQPRFLFPAGAINELSIVDILSDTALITQSGIHAFNAVAYAKRESNNYPLGAKIRGLLTNPTTEKAIVQDKTCAGLYDDYAFFCVNTIHGYGALVYDTISQSFQSLDLSFGHAKQLATTRLKGNERLFFITHDNQIFEAFAGTKKNTTRVLLGEWTPDDAPSTILAYMFDSVFGNVQESGQVKLSVYADRAFKESVVVDITAATRPVNLPIPLPFVEGNQVATAGFHFGSSARAWKMAAMLEWNFAGELTDFSVDGKLESGDNVRLNVQKTLDSESFAFIADSGYSDELNDHSNFDAQGLALVPVVKGESYIYFANGDGVLVNGNRAITENTFVAARDTVAIKGTPNAAKSFSLRTATNYLGVLNAIEQNKNLVGILHGGDFAYPSGTLLDVEMAKAPIKLPLFPVCGNHDIATSSGKYFFNTLEIPRYYYKTFNYIDVFFYNGDPSEPDGIDQNSLQAGILKNWIANSTKPFKILIVHQPPLTNDINHYPGSADLMYLLSLPRLSAVISGHGHVMERFVTNSFPSFVCGAGGALLRSFVPGTSSPFRDDTHYGYLLLIADPLTCKINFMDTDNNVLDSYALYT